MHAHARPLLPPIEGGAQRPMLRRRKSLPCHILPCHSPPSVVCGYHLNQLSLSGLRVKEALHARRGRLSDSFIFCVGPVIAEGSLTRRMHRVRKRIILRLLHRRRRRRGCLALTPRMPHRRPGFTISGFTLRRTRPLLLIRLALRRARPLIIRHLREQRTAFWLLDRRSSRSVAVREARERFVRLYWRGGLGA